jgi:hypothetical protein
MDITISFLTLIPITVGIVEVVKRVGLPKRFLPLLSVLAGIGCAIILGGETTGVIALQGVVVGLSAVGLWSGVSNTVTTKVVAK